jgi:hypothetical protein
MVSSVVETTNARQELAFGVRLLGRTIADFFFETDMFIPTSDGLQDKVQSFCAVSVF